MAVPILGKFNRAKDILAEAEHQADVARKKNGRHRKHCEAEMAALGAEHVVAMDLVLRPFVEAFNQLRNVELEDMADVTSLPVDERRMDPLKQLDFDEWDAITGTMKLAPVVGGAAAAATGSGAVMGAATGAAVWTAGAVGASASTGTAVTSLSGAAATNATLAWLGGGSVAAGGGGVAVGTTVLASAVAGAVVAPAVIVGGIFVNRKGNQALAQAEAETERVEEFVALLDGANSKLDRTAERAKQLAELLARLHEALAPGIVDLQKWVAKEKNFKRYSKKRQASVATTFALISVVAAIVSTPLTTKSGNLTRKSATVLKQAEQALAAVEDEAEDARIKT